jgi:ubiquinone/menaquinone biosynthesis C-methylase UbiE
MAFVNPTQIIQQLGLKEGVKFADFGAGTGSFVLAASPLVGPTGIVYAIEIQKDILLRLKELSIKAGHTNTKFLWCDFEQLNATKLPNESLDIALISNTLFQLNDKQGAIQEAYRTIKTGGDLYIIDWIDSFNGMGPDTDLIISSDKAIELATKAGFKYINTFEPGEHHYGLHFTK